MGDDGIYRRLLHAFFILAGPAPNLIQKEPYVMKIYEATICKAEYCLFNRSSTCTIINRPQLDESGVCEHLTMLKIDENFREQEKVLQLQALEESGMFPLPVRFC